MNRSTSLYSGVDYHQDQPQVCVVDPSGGMRLNLPMSNDVAAVAERLRQAGPVKVVAIEACTGASHFAEALAALGDWRVELAHPGYVRRLRQSPDKSDYSDARLLADLARVGYLPRVWLAPPQVRELRQLVNHRTRYVERQRATKLQIGAILRDHRLKIKGSRWSQPWLMRVRDNPQLPRQVRWIMDDLLEELGHVQHKLRQVEGRLREATADNPLVHRLLKIEGVGEVTAWMLAAWIGRFDRFRTGKQLSRYCGLSPRNASSGTRQADAGLIDAANKSLRAVLVQAAHRLIRTHKRWGALAESMQRRGKPRCVIVAAIANRWVRSIHHRMVRPEAQP